MRRSLQGQPDASVPNAPDNMHVCPMIPATRPLWLWHVEKIMGVPVCVGGFR